MMKRAGLAIRLVVSIIALLLVVELLDYGLDLVPGSPGNRLNMLMASYSQDGQRLSQWLQTPDAAYLLLGAAVVHRLLVIPIAAFVSSLLAAIFLLSRRATVISVVISVAAVLLLEVFAVAALSTLLGSLPTGTPASPAETAWPSVAVFLGSLVIAVSMVGAGYNLGSKIVPRPRQSEV